MNGHPKTPESLKTTTAFQSSGGALEKKHGEIIFY
jgi:hypothetical protein